MKNSSFLPVSVLNNLNLYFGKNRNVQLLIVFVVLIAKFYYPLNSPNDLHISDQNNRC